MERYICIHGHFYQPPREDPWLEAIECQDSAYPYHDWNERIAVECYSPNAASRILDERGRIVRIVNNYSSISFNFGPTLLAWLESNSPQTYAAILEADRRSGERCSGHGSALAQAYNHMILPLASRRDRETQVGWGIRDFRHRFGREPEGMWLPETAVDIETLEVLADHDIRFTVLAPHQARRVRRIGRSEWTDVTGGRIDPTRPYVQRLPSGADIALFFYDGPISRGVAFEPILRNGERFAGRLVDAFSDDRDWPQLVHIATDGETYGHHHRHGDMALSYALRHIEEQGLAKLTNYGEYLERHPPTHQVEIIEDTSWSCAHGIERWRSDCGCRTGGEPGWHQAWRRPLRDALDALRDALAPRYDEAARSLLADPRAARDAYIDVILDRSAASVARFMRAHAGRSLSDEETVTALELLEMQRHAMLMYTSCGWFFNEVSGIETVQVIEYADRAIQLAQKLFGDDLETAFAAGLAEARSNVPEHRDGRHLYETRVKTERVSPAGVAAHHAVASLFESGSEPPHRVYAFTAEPLAGESRLAGRARLSIGRTRVASSITRDSGVFRHGALYFGDHNVAGGVAPDRADGGYEALLRDANAAFGRGDIPGTLRALDRHFDGATLSLNSLLGDARLEVVDRILASTRADAEGLYGRFYDSHAPLIRFLSDLDVPLPKALDMAAEFVLNTTLDREVRSRELDIERIQSVLTAAKHSGIRLDTTGLSYTLQQTIERLAHDLQEQPADRDRLDRLVRAVALARSVPFDVNLWNVQNRYYSMLQTAYPEWKELAGRGDAEARAWLRRFGELGEDLSVAVDGAVPGSAGAGASG